MNKLYIFLAGLLLGVTLPLAIDLLMFGTITPCRTISHFNGNIIQECGDKR